MAAKIKLFLHFIIVGLFQSPRQGQASRYSVSCQGQVLQQGGREEDQGRWWGCSPDRLKNIYINIFKLRKEKYTQCREFF